MKILSIKGKNLASLEGEFTIDFRSEPLRSAGIFAITGNTGSGKTTLLDAMCIALFQVSPRTYKAKGNKSQESDEDNIRENDCRNILRHGTGEGYSEVEFLALDGKEYRARWSVSRARNKADGNLQPSKHTLYCINDNSYIQGSKAETKAAITKLLGLSYEQFTRAVLLAQGEFAAFLKASPNEKADILEKLTGTGIYAQISTKIFEKFRDAESQYKAKEDIIKRIVLLTPEQIENLNKENQILSAQEEEETKNITALQEKLKWIERMQQLNTEYLSAQQSVAKYTAQMESASDTISLLAQIDKIQPVRDSYLEAVRLNKQKRELTQQTERYNKQHAEYNDRHAKIEAEIAECTGLQQKLNRERAEAQPRILEATKLEAEISNHNRLLKENSDKLSIHKQQMQQLCSEQQKIESGISAHTTELNEINSWIATHSIYTPIIEKHPVIENYLREAQDSAKEIGIKNKLLGKAKELQSEFEKNLVESQAECERLKATLTQEIATLRSRLKEGEPCPVCGSLHHRTSTITGNILHEEQLIKAREANEKNIAHITRCIENSKSEVIALTSGIEEYKREYTRKTGMLIESLSGMAPAALHQDDSNLMQQLEELAGRLAAMAVDWNTKRARCTTLQQQLSVEQTTLDNVKKRIAETGILVKEEEELATKISADIKEKHDRITTLLGSNGTVAQIEQQFAKAIEECDKRFTRCTAERIDIIAVLSRIKQSLATANETIEQHTNTIERLRDEIEEFLQNNASDITIEQLNRLATTPPDEISRMRRSIEDIRNSLLQATTKMQERKRNIEQQMQQPMRPAEEETKEVLEAHLQIAAKESQQRKERITQINIELGSDSRNRKESERMHNELASTKEEYDNWRKLNEVFGSAKGHKFRMIAQGYTLDIMLAYANMHLKELSSRYELVRSAPDSLSLMVTDLDMLMERRTVNTLSGGETFLVSLAMALALSSLSSNNMSIESLFIDEGFGSLDSDTLRIAMEALERLQSMGRKIGVISHLQDMIERIPTQIRIRKGRSGKSTIQIVS